MGAGQHGPQTKTESLRAPSSPPPRAVHAGGDLDTVAIRRVEVADDVGPVARPDREDIL